MNPSPIQYFLYARKSSESEDKQVASVPSQIAELNRLAEERKLTVVNIFTEEKSAKAPGRPVFAQMIEAIHKGEANGIICWKLDRLAATRLTAEQSTGSYNKVPSSIYRPSSAAICLLTTF